MTRRLPAILLALVLLALPAVASTPAADKAWDRTFTAGITCVAIDEDGGTIAAGTSGGNITVFSADGTRTWSVLNLGSHAIRDIAVDGSGGHVYYIDANQSFRVLDGATGVAVMRQWFDPTVFGTLRNMSVNADGDAVITTNLAAFVWNDTHSYIGHVVPQADTGAYLTAAAGNNDWLIAAKESNATALLYHWNQTRSAVTSAYLVNESWSSTWAWLDGPGTYAYSKTHTIAGSAFASPLTNYQMHFQLWEAAGTDSGEVVYLGASTVRADWYDIRFYAADGTTALDFWVEEYNATAASVWVEIPYIPVSPGTTDIVLKWSYASAASASSQTNTLEAMTNPGFELTTAWTIQSNGGGSWARTATNKTVGSYSGQVYDAMTGAGAGVTYYAYLNQAITLNTSVDYRLYFDYSAAITVAPASARWQIWKSGTKVWEVTNPTAATRYNQSVDIDGALGAGNLTLASNLTTSAGGSGDISIWFDNLRLVKAVSPAPTHGAWGPTVPDAYTRIYYDAAEALTGAVYQVDTSESGDNAGLQTASNVYAMSVGRSSYPYTLTPAYTTAASSGAARGIAISDSMGFSIDARSLSVDFYALDMTDLGGWTTGGPVAAVDTAQKNGLYACAGSADGMAYIFDKVATTGGAWELLYSSEAEDPVADIAMSWRGEYVVAGRSDGTLTLYRVTLADDYNPPQFPPNEVTFTVKSLFGAPVSGVNVTIVPQNTTVSEFAWLYELLGINDASTPIFDQAMTGITGSDGSTTFVMDGTTNYHVTFENATAGISESMNLYPSQPQYTVYASGSGSGGWFASGHNPLVEVNVSTSAGENTTALGYIGVRYADALSQTTSVSIRINRTNTDGTQTTVNSTTVAGSSSFTRTFSIPNHRGNDYSVNVTAVHTEFGTITRPFAVHFVPGPMSFGLPEDLLLFAGMFLMLFAALLFGQVSTGIGMIVFSFVGWLVFFMGWLRELGSGTVTAMALGLATMIAIVINVMLRSKRVRYE
ncbi:MAG: DUF2341 domain-containing protein [bacterium]